jgi:hypothetical protein
MPTQRHALARQLSEADVARVLQLAAELQLRAAGSASGLTLGDLEQIGAEAGIETKYVRAAALLISGAPDETPLVRAALGTAPRIGIALTLPVMVDSREVERRLEAILVSALGPMRRLNAFHTLSWDSAGARASITRITVIPGRSESRLIIDQDLSAVARNIFTAVIAGLGVFGGAVAFTVLGAMTNSPGLALGAAGGLVAVSVIASRLIYVTRRAAHVAKLNDLIEAIATELASPPAGAA